jgi:hypothetical protein
MSTRSAFFDSDAGDRVYSSGDLARVVGAIIGSGIVYGQGDEFAVAEANPPAMTVAVGLGRAFVLGYFFEVYGEPETLAIAAAHASQPRIDRVVIRRDLAARTAELAVLTGAPAASPAAPGLTQNEGGVYEIPVARIAVGAAVTSITNANITDERGDRAHGTDIGALLDAATGHRHGGVDGDGRKVRYGDLAEVPVAFPPELHGHDVGWTDVTGKPLAFPPSAHGHIVDWVDINAKPTTFPPSGHKASHATGGGDALTAADLRAVEARNTPNTLASGRKLYVGTSEPTGAAEGDVWVKG